MCNRQILDFMGTHCGRIAYPLRDSAGGLSAPSSWLRIGLCVSGRCCIAVDCTWENAPTCLSRQEAQAHALCLSDGVVHQPLSHTLLRRLAGIAVLQEKRPSTPLAAHPAPIALFAFRNIFPRHLAITGQSRHHSSARIHPTHPASFSSGLARLDRDRAIRPGRSSGCTAPSHRCQMEIQR